MIPESDSRSPARRALDDQIAAEPKMSPLEVPENVATAPMEAYLPRRRMRPLAVAGIVENGLVRPLDPTVILTEHSRVIIVASEGS